MPKRWFLCLLLPCFPFCLQFMVLGCLQAWLCWEGEEKARLPQGSRRDQCFPAWCHPLTLQTLTSARC